MTVTAMLCIDRCVCRRARFAELLPLAREHGWSLETLVNETGCGDQCGMCLPYLRAMLNDGTIVFDHILQADVEAR